MATKKQPQPRFTTRQVMAGFKVSDMTVFTWRKGTTTRDPLPVEQDGRNVYFPEKSTLAWAKKYDLPFDKSNAEKVLAGATPGPKPVAVKKVPVKAVKKTVVPAKAVKKVKKVRKEVRNVAVHGPASAHI